MTTGPRSQSWRRRAPIASAVLLGVTLLVLARGSWVGVVLSPSSDLGGGDLQYLLEQPDLVAIGPFRLWLVGGAVLLWAVPLAWSRTRPYRGTLVIPWLACVAIATAQWLTLRSFSDAYDANLTRVIDEARRNAGATPWTGLFGVADLAGDLTALTPDHRFARHSWGCMGTTDISWGRYVEDGAAVELIPERVGFWRWALPGGRLAPKRVHVVESTSGHYRYLEEMADVRDGRL